VNKNSAPFINLPVELGGEIRVYFGTYDADGPLDINGFISN